MSTPRSLDLPRCARTLRVTTTRGELAAVEALPAGTPRGTALLVPGFTGSKEDFGAVLEPLAAEGWRVLAYDQRGQYESPHGPDTAYDLAELAADALAVAGLLDAGPTHLVGHSLGGLVAAAAVRSRPDSWASLTLLCSGPGALPQASRGQAALLVQALGSMSLAQIWAVMRQLDAEAGVVQPPAPIAEFLERRFLANDPVALRRLGEHLVGEPDRAAELRATAAAAGLPLLVAHGVTDDRWPPQVQADMARRLFARYEVIPRAAHSPAVEAPEATARLLGEFWHAAGGQWPRSTQAS